MRARLGTQPTATHPKWGSWYAPAFMGAPHPVGSLPPMGATGSPEPCPKHAWAQPERNAWGEMEK